MIVDEFYFMKAKTELETIMDRGYRPKKIVYKGQ
jgi:hypothetical protein